MDKNIFKATTNNKTGKILFYIFEISALVFFVIQFILCIIAGARAGFGVFVESFLNTVVYTLFLYAFGKIIDLLSGKQKDKTNTNNETTTIEEN